MLLDIRIHSKYKWIAKDQCGMWYAFIAKPIQKESYYGPNGDGPESAHVPIEVSELKGVNWKSCCFELVDGKIKFNLEKDTPVLVRDDVNKPWFKRHFHSFDNAGRIVCYQDGKTSWSSEGEITTWQEWKLPTIDLP